MPVFNGDRYLREAIDSVLAQTFEDTELIISDNASTDGTAAICCEYAQRDRRVRYIRQMSNIGAPLNYSFLISPARGRYFKWASANDICEPTAVARCVEVLERHADFVLCYGRTQLISGTGAAIEIYSGDFAVHEERASERFRSLRMRLAMNNAQNGVIRLAALRRTRLLQPYEGSDLTMMAALALQGKFELLPEVLLNRRMTDDSFSSRLSESDLRRFLNPEFLGSVRLDRLRLHLDQCASILIAPISWREKSLALTIALRSLFWDRGRVLQELQSWLSSFVGGGHRGSADL